MRITEALKGTQTGMLYRTRPDGDQVRIMLKDGRITRIWINDVLVDQGEGVEGEISIDLEDLFSDDWEIAQVY
jgi:hypothetical protein